MSERLKGASPPQVVDVRELYETRICTIGGTLIPLGQLPGRLRELDPSRDTVVYCRTGVRSAMAVRLLKDEGFDRVWNLRGGVYAWSDDVDSSMPKY